MELQVLRDSFTDNSTGGSLHQIINNNLILLCETLEDARRFPGVKCPGSTCIPAGRYKVSVSKSTRFKRDLPMIYNCANGYQLKAENISFTGVRMHGGNTHKDTDGCVLVAYNEIDDDTIQGTAEIEITSLIQDAIHGCEEVWIEFIDVLCT